MASITFKGNPVHTSGELPAKGAAAPDFKLTATDLSEATLASWQGKKKILNIFPSVDTGVCAASARAFNQRADAHPDLVILNVSADLPFAHARFCGAEGLERVIPLSMMRSKDFARDYGVLMEDGPLAGLAARAVVALDESNRVIYTELVPEIGQEPNYDAALAAVE